MTGERKQFRYAAYDEKGGLVEGRLLAVSPRDASEQLWGQRLTAFELTEHGKAGAGGGRLFGNGPPTTRDIAAFTREFATLAQAGIPLDDALRIMIDQPGRSRMRPVASSLLDAVINGSSFSEALATLPRTFTADYVNVARAGEAGSDRARVFGELADLLERRVELANRVASAFVYPAILMITALASIAAIMGVLVPSLAPVFAEGGRQMPALIAIVMGIQESWPIVAGAAVAMAAAAAVGWRAIETSPAARRSLDTAILRAPLIGGQIGQQNFARFARTLGSLLKAGVPMLPAFLSAQSVIKNRAIAGDMQLSADALRNGEPLSRALSGRIGVPPIVLRMITVGQEAAKLDVMLIKVAEMLETQTHRRIERLMTMLTPMLTLAIAGVVGGLIYTVMTAVLSISELATQ